MHSMFSSPRILLNTALSSILFSSFLKSPIQTYMLKITEEYSKKIWRISLISLFSTVNMRRQIYSSVLLTTHYAMMVYVGVDTYRYSNLESWVV